MPLLSLQYLHLFKNAGIVAQAIEDLKRKKQLSKALLSADFTITDRRYIGHEDDTGYHHYAIDVAKTYETEE